jgi:hypothetical protein
LSHGITEACQPAALLATFHAPFSARCAQRPVRIYERATRVKTHLE